MDESTVLDLREFKIKLRNISGSVHKRDFYNLFADRLNDEMIINGVKLALELLIYDLIKGQSGYGSKISSSLCGLPKTVYILFQMGAEKLISELEKNNV